MLKLNDIFFLLLFPSRKSAINFSPKKCYIFQQILLFVKKEETPYSSSNIGASSIPAQMRRYEREVLKKNIKIRAESQSKGIVQVYGLCSLNGKIMKEEFFRRELIQVHVSSIWCGFIDIICMQNFRETVLGCTTERFIPYPLSL